METQLLNFWKEAFKKEASIRLGWQLKYSKIFAKQARERAARKSDAVAATSNVSKHIKRMEKELSKLGTASEEQPEEKEDKSSESTLSEYRPMRPVSPKTREQLYDGISHHGEGRYAYLKKRKQKAPEEKYIYPLQSSCEYGWKIRDQAQFPKSMTPRYTRTRIVKDTFYRQSGILFG